MSLNIFTTAAEKAYVELMKSRNVENDIMSVLFPRLDMSTATEVRLDRYFHAATPMRIAKYDEPSNSRVIQAGEAVQHVPPVLAEKRIIDAEMRDAAIAGTTETDYALTVANRARQVMEGGDGFVESLLMAQRYAVIQYALTGKYRLINSLSQETEEYDFNRDAANSMDADLTRLKFDGAIANAYQITRNHYAPAGDLVAICGKNWINLFDTDAVILKKRNAAIAADLMHMNMLPEILKGVEGLNVIGRYRCDGMTSAVWVMSYEPNQGFRLDENATPESYIPDDMLIFFSLASGGYRFYRGVNVTNTEHNWIDRKTGSLVLDSTIIYDPPTEAMRAQSRFFFLPTNANHIVAIKGTNF